METSHLQGFLRHQLEGSGWIVAHSITNCRLQRRLAPAEECFGNRLLYLHRLPGVFISCYILNSR